METWSKQATEPALPSSLLRPSDLGTASISSSAVSFKDKNLYL